MASDDPDPMFPPAAADLPDSVVHLWRWRLDGPTGNPDGERVWLTQEERTRAARYRFELPRRSFVAARIGLRRILSGYLGCEDLAKLTFALGPDGKPALAFPAHGWLRFNLAHCDDFVICAISRDREVGVDIERERAGGSRATADTLVYATRHLCSPVEQRWLAQEPLDARESAFLALWTCKEAIGKARGTGLKPPIPTFDALLASGCALPHAWHQHEDAQVWWVARIEPFAETVGALAVEMSGRDVEREIRLTWFEGTTA